LLPLYARHGVLRTVQKGTLWLFIPLLPPGAKLGCYSLMGSQVCVCPYFHVLFPTISQSSSSIPSPLSSFSSYLRTLLTLSPLSARPTPYVYAAEGRKFVPFACPPPPCVPPLQPHTAPGTLPLSRWQWNGFIPRTLYSKCALCKPRGGSNKRLSSEFLKFENASTYLFPTCTMCMN
jgi:hypothetical protein